VLTLNQAAREILMVPAGAAPGRPLAALAAPIAEALDALDPRESARRIEVDHTLESGKTLHLGITVSPLVDHTDRVHGRIINFQDLSEMREMELQVKQAERLATIGTIAAGVAHELRNPLASISGSIELLRSGAEDPADSAALMDIVTREVGRLDSLISELLEYTNPRPRQAVRFDLVELIRETLRVFSQDKKVEGVSVELETRDQPIHVTADPAKLRQVLWNLLRNAVEAARAGGGTVAVELSRSQEQALIDISDDGPGIAGDAVARIFEPFYTTRSGGTGLGLAIVRNIVSDHGGDIDVETEVGRGSRFSVSLPLGEPAERED
jgi:two-component system sensor histidine kinase PilS (NtrC family)